jgi:hypothetical protein
VMGKWQPDRNSISITADQQRGRQLLENGARWSAVEDETSPTAFGLPEWPAACPSPTSR